MQELTLKYEEMPKSIVAFYTKISNNEYIVLNKLHNVSTAVFAAFACLYYKENGMTVGKIELSDLEKKDFAPVEFARNKLKEILRNDICESSSLCS